MTKIAIHVEVDDGDPSADPDHYMGITNEAYERLSGFGPGSLSWLGEVQDVEKEDEDE